ncbi:carboxypeptidase-like regulatory domain-containing protein [Planctomicrobium sp. SH664]|uniref:carboxypeptidase-like regulatory domain-containing protein n=1 Tax=Planctomicrobium sp. SH664 TaxID=3448125 RepID=UPI003F5BA947
MKRQKRMARWFGSGLALAMLALTGCSQNGPELASVSGVVTLDGSPLDQATIVFQPATGRASTGSTDSEGKYTLKFTSDRPGVIPGRSMVYITSQTVDFNGNVVRKEILPARYNRESELAVEVADAPNTFDFALESK